MAGGFWSSEDELAKIAERIKYVSKFNKELFEAVAEGNSKNVLKCVLGTQAELNSCDPNKNTPLLLAIKCLIQAPFGSESFNEYNKIIKILLVSGALANCKDANGNTPLHLAIIKMNGIPIEDKLMFEAYKKIVRNLILSGASLGIPNNERLTPNDLIPKDVIEPIKVGCGAT